MQVETKKTQQKSQPPKQQLFQHTIFLSSEVSESAN